MVKNQNQELESCKLERVLGHLKGIKPNLAVGRLHREGEEDEQGATGARVRWGGVSLILQGPSGRTSCLGVATAQENDLTVLPTPQSWGRGFERGP